MKKLLFGLIFTVSFSAFAKEVRLFSCDISKYEVVGDSGKIYLKSARNLDEEVKVELISEPRGVFNRSGLVYKISNEKIELLINAQFNKGSFHHSEGIMTIKDSNSTARHDCLHSYKL